MCGIFGWMLDEPHPLQRTMLASVLAEKNDSRGKDAWGCLRLLPDNKYSIHKQLGLAGTASSVYETHDENFVLAHTRFGTVGAKDDKNNAHPFTFRSKAKKHAIIGVHNGSVSNHDKLDSKHGVRFTVDSEHIFYSLMKDENMKGLEGYGVAVWYDTRRPNELLFSKLTGGGDLAIAKLKGVKGFAWSSMESSLREAVGRADWGIDKMYTIESKKVYSLKLGDTELRTSGLPDVEFASWSTPSSWAGSHSSGYAALDFDWPIQQGVPIKMFGHTNLSYFKCACTKWKKSNLPDHQKAMEKAFEGYFKGSTEEKFPDEAHVTASFSGCRPKGGCSERDKHYAWVWNKLNLMGKLTKDGHTLPAEDSVIPDTKGDASSRPTPPLSLVKGTGGQEFIGTVDGVVVIRNGTAKDTPSTQSTTSTERVYAPFTDEDAAQFFDVAFFKWFKRRLPNNPAEVTQYAGVIYEASRNYFRENEWHPMKEKARAKQAVDQLKLDEDGDKSGFAKLIDAVANKLDKNMKADTKAEPEWQEQGTIDLTGSNKK